MSDPFVDNYPDIVDEMFTGRAQTNREQLSQEEAEQLQREVKHVVSSRSGRNVLWWILEQGNMFASTYNGRALDQAFLDGRRTLAADLFALVLKAEPTAFMQMVNDKITKEEEHGRG